MFEYLLTHNNTDNPTAMAILITVLCSLFLGSLIVLTYELTTRDIYKPAHFLQAMALISIVAATVMQAIGDSLARGLGMLGALAIIRFRTVLNDPRNMAFMFASIAAGIACGVFGFTIAFIGTIGFCTTAVLLRFSPLSKQDELVGKLKIEIPKNSNSEQEIDRILNSFCQEVELEQIRFLNLRKTAKTRDIAGNVIDETPLEHLKEFSYQLRIKRNKSIGELTSRLEEMDDIRDLRLRFEKPAISL